MAIEIKTKPAEKAYKYIEISALTGALGAEVGGVDLSKPLDKAVIDEIHDAWLNNLVLFFRDQDLTPEQQVSFAHYFGDFQKPGFVPTLDDHPNVRRQEYDDQHKIGGDISFHADDTFLEIPSKASVLYALDVPVTGGDTIWVNMYAAYEALSDHMQRFLSSLTAIHDVTFRLGAGILKQRGAEALGRLMETTPPVEHPVVRTHPETGRKLLFVSELMTAEIVGMSPAESAALLEFLRQHTYQPELQCRFRWRKHSIAFWDNRASIHRGINDFWPAHRLMHRVAIADTARPV